MESRNSHKRILKVCCCLTTVICLVLTLMLISLERKRRQQYRFALSAVNVLLIENEKWSDEGAVTLISLMNYYDIDDIYGAMLISTLSERNSTFLNSCSKEDRRFLEETQEKFDGSDTRFFENAY